MLEDDKQIKIYAEMAGMRKEDINLEVKDNVLTIQGEKMSRAEEPTKGKGIFGKKGEKGLKWHRVETRSGSFRRTMRLPLACKDSEIAADYLDGVLVVTIPKKPSKPATKIAIK